MKEFTTLSKLAPGERGTICESTSPGTLHRRLLDLGFVPGGEVRCLFAGAAGDPRAYLIRGTVIALRQEDAERITLVKEEKG